MFSTSEALLTHLILISTLWDSPHYINKQKWGTDRQSNLPKIIQLINGRNGFQPKKSDSRVFAINHNHILILYYCTILKGHKDSVKTNAFLNICSP